MQRRTARPRHRRDHSAYTVPIQRGAIYSGCSLPRDTKLAHYRLRERIRGPRPLAAIHDRIRKLGARVVSIMPDSAMLTADYAKKNDLPFPVLSDIDLGYSLSLGLIFWVGAEVQRLYQDVGVDLEKYQANAGYFLPMAAKFIVGRDGLVKARQVNIEFRERMEPDAIVAALEQLRA